MNTQLSRIRIVLVNPHHPGNVGAVARAMKTMGLTQLVLVAPIDFPHPEATSRAAGAADLLEDALVVESLESALSDCTQVFATSARRQHAFGRPLHSCEQAVNWIKSHPLEQIAIVFGRERDGLNATELDLCQQLLFIPGNPDYDVLNLGAAVQIVCYELFRQLNDSSIEDARAEIRFAPRQQIEHFYQQLGELLEARGYIRPEQPSDTLKRLKSLLNRAQADAAEYNLLRGMMLALTRQAQTNDKDAT